MSSETPSSARTAGGSASGGCAGTGDAQSPLRRSEAVVLEASPTDVYNLPLSEYYFVVDAQPAEEFRKQRICCAWPLFHDAVEVSPADGGLEALVDAVVTRCWDTNPPDRAASCVVYDGGPGCKGPGAAAVAAALATLAHRIARRRPLTIYVMRGGLPTFSAAYPWLTVHGETPTAETGGAGDCPGARDGGAESEKAEVYDPCAILVPDPYPACIEPGLFLGSAIVAEQAATFVRCGVRRVLNVTVECPNYFEAADNAAGVDVEYERCPVLDDLGQDMSEAFEMSFDFIDRALREGAPVLVHCHQGRSRSVACVIHFLMKRHGRSYQRSLEHVQRARPGAQPNESFEKQLLEAEQRESATRGVK